MADARRRDAPTGRSSGVRVTQVLAPSVQDSSGINRIACAGDYLDQRRVRRGKTTFAEELHRRLPDAVVYDPEDVGLMLWK